MKLRTIICFSLKCLNNNLPFSVASVASSAAEPGSAVGAVAYHPGKYL